MGSVKVESKEDLAKSTRPGGPVSSPNLADAFVMAFAAPSSSRIQISENCLETGRNEPMRKRRSEEEILPRNFRFYTIVSTEIG